VRLLIKVPNEPENEQWKLTGQTITVEIDVKDAMKQAKVKIMVKSTFQYVIFLVFNIITISGNFENASWETTIKSTCSWFCQG